MNRTLYYDLMIWLMRHKVRKEADEWTKNIIKIAGRQYEIQGSILYRKKSETSIPVITQGQEQEIIKLAHDHPLSGHMGQDNTYYRLKEEAWWPGIQEDIKKYIRSCDIYQKRTKKK